MNWYDNAQNVLDLAKWRRENAIQSGDDFYNDSFAATALNPQEYGEEWLQYQESLKQEPTLSERAKEIAHEIANDLFSGGISATQANRLVLEFDGSNYRGTGWCKRAVVDRIAQRLEALEKEREE